jgi:hypothetical protein
VQHDASPLHYFCTLLHYIVVPPNHHENLQSVQFNQITNVTNPAPSNNEVLPQSETTISSKGEGGPKKP